MFKSKNKNADDDDLLSTLNAQVVQDGLGREEKQRIRKEERALICERQEQDEKRHECLNDKWF